MCTYLVCVHIFSITNGKENSTQFQTQFIFINLCYYSITLYRELSMDMRYISYYKNSPFENQMIQLIIMTVNIFYYACYAWILYKEAFRKDVFIKKEVN